MTPASNPGGYVGKMLRVDLSSGKISVESLDDATLREYPGGTILGAKVLYDEIPPGVKWSDPQNRLFFGAGPLGGTEIAGSGTFSVMSKGALTEGSASSQANGNFGAYLKLAGYDAVVIQGASDKLAYLYIDNEGNAEIRDAAHLAGKDTWENEDLIKEELNQPGRKMSVFGIGPAGENLVRFSCIVGDRGHVAAHNGQGAVMGSKKLKAIAISQGKGTVPVHDPEGFTAIAKKLLDMVVNGVGFADIYHWGTSKEYSFDAKIGTLPVKNYTQNSPDDFPEHPDFMGEVVRPKVDLQRSLCWKCPNHHCHIMTIKEGPYAGFVGEEPEYEAWAAWGAQTGNKDPMAAIVLSNDIDRLGMDTNEGGWLVGFVMECHEKGLITKNDLDGLEMTWGNVEATRQLLKNIANRRGFGNVLAEGTMRAAKHVGGEAIHCAVHTMKGNTPRGHDHRSVWTELFSTSVSDGGTLGDRPFAVHLFDPKAAVKSVVSDMGNMYFEDSMGTCWFNMGLLSFRLDAPEGLPVQDFSIMVDALNAATGWNFTTEDALKAGRRAVHLLRAFNHRHGITADLDAPSPRYGSTPTGGPAKGQGIMPHWDSMRRDYYKQMGWDEDKGIPSPDTLKAFDLERVIEDLWK